MLKNVNSNQDFVDFIYKRRILSYVYSPLGVRLSDGDKTFTEFIPGHVYAVYSNEPYGLADEQDVDMVYVEVTQFDYDKQEKCYIAKETLLPILSDEWTQWLLNNDGSIDSKGNKVIVKEVDADDIIKLFNQD